MNILILNRFSHKVLPYCDWLKNSAKLFMLCDESVKESIPVNQYEKVIFLPNWKINGNVEKIASELHKKYRFKAIISQHESDILRAATLREILEIEGQNISSAEAFRNKIIMKTILKENGIQQPEFKKIEHPLDLVNFSEKHNFPLVIKPVDGYGSIGTTILSDNKDLETILGKIAFQPYMVESFVSGDMYHIDGVCKNGNLEFICVSKYINDCLSFQSSTYNGGYLLEDSDPTQKRLVDYTKKIINILPTPINCAFHCEVFINQCNEIIFCEIASRAGGSLIVPMIESAFNYNISKEAIFAQIGCETKDKKLPFKHSVGYLLIPPKIGTCIAIPDHLPMSGVISYEMRAKKGDTYNIGTWSGYEICSCIIKGNSSDSIIKTVEDVVNFFYENSKWVS